MSRLLFDEILELSTDERVQLAQRIWESVYAHPETLSLTATQRDELERRWVSFQQSPDEGEEWEEVKKALLEE